MSRILSDAISSGAISSGARVARLLALAFAGVLAGCATTRSVYEPAPGEPGAGAQNQAAPAYVPEPGRDAGAVAQMRAAPAPATALIEPGKNVSADASRLAAASFVRIGSGRYRGGEDAVREEAAQQGRAVGADRILLYAPAAGESDWLAAYFVRVKLAFGASFRDINAAERATLGADGGVQIGSVIGGTPASRANLIAGDYVTKVDGHPIAGKAAFQDLLRAGIGRSVTLTVVRNGEPLQRVVRLSGTDVPAR